MPPSAARATTAAMTAAKEAAEAVHAVSAAAAAAAAVDAESALPASPVTAPSAVVSSADDEPLGAVPCTPPVELPGSAMAAVVAVAAEGGIGRWQACAERNLASISISKSISELAVSDGHYF